MINKVCDTCNFCVGIDYGGSKIQCVYDSQLHQKTDTCNHWQQNNPIMSTDQRTKLASDLRNSEEAERRHKESLKSAELSRKLQIKIALFGFLAGILATLLTQLILSLWEK